MAEATKKASEVTTPPAEPTKPADVRPIVPSVSGPASESGDPAVHQLLAERQTITMNDGDTSAVDEQLVKLGFTEYRR